MLKRRYFQTSGVHRKKELLQKALIGRGRVYTLVGKYEEAISDYSTLRKVGGDLETIIDSLIGLAKLYGITGKLSKSDCNFKKGLQIASKHKKDFRKATILNGLSLNSIDETKYEFALKYARGAIYLFKKIKGNKIERQKGIAEGFGNIGGIYSHIGKQRKALEFYEKSLEVSKILGDKEGMAVSLNNLGTTFISLTKYREAHKYLKKSLELRKKTGYIQGSALCLNNIGIALWKQGRFLEGVKFLKESLKIQKRLGNISGIATSLNNLAVVYRIYGRFRESLECHKESLRIRKQIGDRFCMTINLNQMGMIYAQQGNYRKALFINEQEGKICKEIKNELRLMNHYGLKAYILDAKKWYAESYELYKKALAISRKYDILSDEIRFLRELSQVIIDSQKIEKKALYSLKQAEDFVESSLELTKKVKKGFEYCKVLTTASELHRLRKNYNKALLEIENAEKIAETVKFKEFLPEIYLQKSRVLHYLKEFFKSMKYRKKAMVLAKSLNLKPVLQKIEKFTAEASN